MHAKPPPSPAEQLANAQAWVRSAVTRLWPSGVAGEPLAIDIGTGQSDPLAIRVVHLGSPLGPDAIESIRRAIGASLAREIELIDAAIPAGPFTFDAARPDVLAQVAAALRLSAAITDIAVCVAEPAPTPRRKRTDSDAQALADMLRALLVAHPRVETRTGELWQIEFVRGACKTAAETAARD